MELRVIPWSSEDPPTEEDVKTELTEQELKVYRWACPPEGVFASHTHGYHKILYVIEGSIKFDLPTQHQSINLTRGDRLDLPAGIRHSAVAGTDGVTCLEAHIY